MKVVSSEAMAALEKLAYQQGFQADAFMEKAGEGVAIETDRYARQGKLDPTILLLCGKGNNAGDAFVAGRYLLNLGYTVCAVQLESLEACSPLCRLNASRFLKKGGKIFSSLEDLSAYSLIIDGLFGTGFKGSPTAPYASVIQQANQSRLPILAIDIPSGLDGNTGQAEGAVIKATQTFFLGLPKTGFFLEKAWNAVGALSYVDFGLPSSIVEQARADFILLTKKTVASLLPPIIRTRNKYQAGYVVGLAGSPGMPGAALLSSLASLRGGAGMMRLLHPDGMQAELSSSPYELIKTSYDSREKESILAAMQKATATFIGPGFGRSEEAKKLLQEIVPLLQKPCVIDADALTLLSEETFSLPKQTVLTPHTGEMARLLHQTTPLIIDKRALETCQHYAEEKNVTLVLKGAPTFIFHPGWPILVNPTGDPGMATAGSGDVLTGLIGALLAQGLNCRDASAVGVYIHGLAGEFAAQAKTSYSLIASDLIHHFSDAYQACQS